MGKDSQFKSSADTAYDIICDQILSGKLAPGRKLTRREMAKLTGVSIIPVIEALHRLEAEGLVESQPRWGSRVITLSTEVLRDRLFLREAVEVQVARILSKYLTEEQENLLVFTASQIDEYEEKGADDSVTWEANRNLHLRMAEFTGCQSLVDALHRSNLFFLVRGTVQPSKPNERPFVKRSHSKLIKAILSKDADNAEDAMRKHIFESRLLSRDDKFYNI